MANKAHLFRSTSLARLASPDQLDQVMQVTRPASWIALAAIGILLGVAVVWGIVGSVADKVQGRGILVRSGGVMEVVSGASGRVTDVSVQVGDSIQEGQVIAWLAQPETVEELQRAKETLAGLRQELAAATRFAAEEARLHRESVQQQRLTLNAAIVADQEGLVWLGERIRAQEQLVQQGLLTRAALLATRQQHNETREQIRESNSELAQLALQEEVAADERKKRLQEKEFAVREATAQVGQLERRLRERTQVVSPYTGRILEILTEPGKILDRNEPILTLDLTGSSVQQLMAIVYVPSVHGKRVRPGMRIEISPSTVRKEEYGMMLGTVTFVSDFPATHKGILRVLKNDKLVTDLSGNDAPYQIHANLIVDPSTTSRYRWSSSKGPPMKVESGTLAAATVTISEQRPVGLVLPILHRAVGF